MVEDEAALTAAIVAPALQYGHDGACVRPRPERSDHVGSYDVVEDRTHNEHKPQGRGVRHP